MRRFLKPLIILLAIAIILPVLANAEFWAKQSNGQLYTNTGNGLGNATINVDACNGCTDSGIPIGTTITSGTTGSILFVGSGPVLAQNNSKLFWDNVNNYLGLGTTTPAGQLDIKGTNTTATVGPEMIALAADRDFSSNTGNWTGTNWTIGAGVATHTAGANNFTLSNSALTNPAVAGKLYLITYTITTTTPSAFSGVFAQFGNSGGGGNFGEVTGTIDVIGIASPTTVTNPFRFNLSNNETVWTGTVDNISIKEITPTTPTQILRNSAGTITTEIRGSTGSDVDNLFIGTKAGRTVTSAGDNTVIGNGSGTNITTAQNNTILGFGSGTQITSATGNILIGRLAGTSINSSVNNIFIGNNAGSSYKDPSAFNGGNILIGNSAGLKLTYGKLNTIIGYTAGQNKLTTGDYNVFVGYEAGINNSGTRNNFFGASAGYSAVAGGTGARNNFFGTSAGDFITSASDDIFIGDQAGNATTSGNNNLYLGTNAGHNTTTGSNNACLGYKVCDTLTTGSNNIAIGYDIDLPSTNGSSQLTIGNLIFGTGLDGSGTSLSSGNIGIGVAVPTATLHLRASTAAANTASVKMDAGTIASVPVSGNIESDGTHIYWTDTSNVRHQLDN